MLTVGPMTNYVTPDSEFAAIKASGPSPSDLLFTSGALSILGEQIDKLDGVLAGLIDRISPALLPSHEPVSDRPRGAVGEHNGVTAEVLICTARIQTLAESVIHTTERVAL